MMKYFFTLIACFCVLFWACGESASADESPDGQETVAEAPKTIDQLYQLILQNKSLDSTLQDSTIGSLLLQMQGAVLMLDQRMQSIRTGLTAAKENSETQTGILINQPEYDELRKQMAILSAITNPLCDRLGGLEPVFNAQQWTETSSEAQDADFGDPPMANEITLEEIMDDAHATEAVIVQTVYDRLN